MRRWVLGLVAATCLGGCATGIFIQHDPQREALASLEPGRHTRGDVLTALGEPFVSFPDRGVDVFQRSGELTDVLLPGIPYTTEWNYYTLISYDGEGTLTGIDSGGYVYRSTLRADRFRYQMGYPGTLLEQERLPTYDVRADECVTILVAVGTRWSDALYFRDPIRLNDVILQGPPDYSSYSYHRLAPGRQTLSVTWGGSRGPWTREAQFDCAAGELRFVTLAADRKEAPIHISADVPPELPGRALVLFPPRTDAPVLPR